MLKKAHIALIRLLLEDDSSNLWWWCTLYTEGDEDGIIAGVNGESKMPSKKRKREKDENNINEENLGKVVGAYFSF